jgi:hypothetical protein
MSQLLDEPQEERSFRASRDLVRSVAQTSGRRLLFAQPAPVRTKGRIDPGGLERPQAGADGVTVALSNLSHDRRGT